MINGFLHGQAVMTRFPSDLAVPDGFTNDFLAIDDGLHGSVYTLDWGLRQALPDGLKVWPRTGVAELARAQVTTISLKLLKTGTLKYPG